MISPMQQVVIAMRRRESEAVITALQHAGVVHLKPIEGGPLRSDASHEQTSEDLKEAERLLADLARRCGPETGEDNPARALAWSVWGRAPLLLAAPDAEALPQAWQHLLARVGKTLGVPAIVASNALISGN